jgi:hypothetical protein
VDAEDQGTVAEQGDAQVDVVSPDDSEPGLDHARTVFVEVTGGRLVSVR